MIELRPSFRRKLAGWVLMLVGVLGLILPFLNGTLFLVAGMFVMRHQYAWSQRGVAWAAGKWPGMMARVEEIEGKLAIRARRGEARLAAMFRRA